MGLGMFRVFTNVNVYIVRNGQWIRRVTRPLPETLPGAACDGRVGRFLMMNEIWLKVGGNQWANV